MKTEKKSKNIDFRLHLNVIMGICTGVLCAAAALIVIICAVSDPREPLFILLMAGALCAVFAAVMLIFDRKIYRPIKKLEHALNVVSDVENITDFELEIDEKSELREIAGYVNKMIYRLKELANREYSAMLLVKQAELNALQTQINPHFLYNTLDSIRGLALKEGQENISKMTKALSGIFRYSISKTDDLSTLREEIKNVENYLVIQQLRFSDKFIFIKDIETDAEEDILDCLMPKLTIQPIVENAVFHGLEAKIGMGTIILSAYTTEKRLVISIEDDGIGIDGETLERINDRLLGIDASRDSRKKGRTTSIALTNVNERIKLFFGDEYGLRVMSTLQLGTTVEISLPLQK